MAGVLDFGRVGMVMRNDWSADTQYERLDVVKYKGGAWAAVSTSVAVGTPPSVLGGWMNLVQGRETLNADTTFYVRPDGNDNNDGGANTSASAFKTPQGAVNSLLRYDFQGYSPTISIADGTYPSLAINWQFLSCGAAAVYIEGQGANTILTNQSGENYVTTCAGTRVIFKRIKCSAMAGSYVRCFQAMQGSTVTIENCYSVGTADALGVQSVSGSTISCIAHGLSGSFSRALSAMDLSQLVASGLCTVSGSVSQGFAYSTTGSFLNSTTTFSGSMTGPRYNASLRGLIYVGGAGVNFFPGSVAGSADAATGGLYV